MKRLVVLTVALLFAISAGAAAQQKAASKKTMVANGTVKSVSAGSLTISSSGKDMTFTVDKDTKVVAKGGTTKANAAKDAGKGLTITDIVKTDDRVTVNYHDMGGGTLHAANVRVR